LPKVADASRLPLAVIFIAAPEIALQHDAKAFNARLFASGATRQFKAMVDGREMQTCKF
jgi:hypothetical protein